MTKLNPLDTSIVRFIQAFEKIPNYKESMKDPDLKRVHIFIAMRFTGLYQTRDLVLKAFLPKVNEQIVDVKKQINSSIYKQTIQNTGYNIEELKFDTIRLGYVMVFHKYEILVKDLFNLLDELSEAYKETKEQLDQYCKRRLGFDAKAWFNYPIVHKVNFISNCTKHQDGFCKLDKPTYTKPIEFINIPETQKIDRTSQEFKADTDLLINSVQTLFKIIGSANMLRTRDNSVNATYSFEGVDYPLYKNEEKEELSAEILSRENEIRTLIMGYKEAIA